MRSNRLTRTVRVLALCAAGLLAASGAALAQTSAAQPPPPLRCLMLLPCTSSTAPRATRRSAPAPWARPCCPKAWSACAPPRCCA